MFLMVRFVVLNRLLTLDTISLNGSLLFNDSITCYVWFICVFCHSLHDDDSVFFYDNICRVIRFTILYWYCLFLGSLSLDDTVDSCLISNGWHSLTLRFTPNLWYNTYPRFVIIYDTETDYGSFSSLILCSYMSLLYAMVLYIVRNHYT